MDKQFEKRMERAKNPRVRKHHVKRPPKFERPTSNVAVFIEELTNDRGEQLRGDPLSQTLYSQDSKSAQMFAAPAKVAAGLAVAATMDGIGAVKKQLGKKERMRKLKMRRKYYAAETAKREAKREQIRAAQAAPANPCPTPEMLIDAYLHRHDTPDSPQHFGELMIDLEEHARRAFAFADNRIAGSSGGVKDWLKENCPLLAAHYSTCQRYKRLAQEDSAQ